jgi:outer membrane lipoprotein-sorting protein
MKYTFIIICSLVYINLSAQTDPKSKTILDKTSEINNGYASISSEFNFITTDLQTNKSETQHGEIAMKGEKYQLKFNKSIIVFDGKSIYNFLTETNEVNITNPEPAKEEKGDFFITNPRDVFKFYTKNFKSKWIKETTIKNSVFNEIDLYPINLKTKYSKITMLIDKTTYQISTIKVSFKDGTRQTIEFLNFKANPSLSDSQFSFDTNKYPNLTVNDMRF